MTDEIRTALAVLRDSIAGFERLDRDRSDRMYAVAGDKVARAADTMLKAIQLRQVDEHTLGVTLDGVDVQVRTEGNATTVSVGAEEAPDDRHVVVQDWSSIAWEQEIKTPS